MFTTRASLSTALFSQKCRQFSLVFAVLGALLRQCAFRLDAIWLATRFQSLVVHWQGRLPLADQIFDATLALDRREISSRSLARVLIAYPLMTLKVIIAIHWQALKLWWKGAGYRNRPEPPKAEVSGAPTRQRHAS